MADASLDDFFAKKDKSKKKPKKQVIDPESLVGGETQKKSKKKKDKSKKKEKEITEDQPKTEGTKVTWKFCCIRSNICLTLFGVNRSRSIATLIEWQGHCANSCFIITWH